MRCLAAGIVASVLMASGAEAARKHNVDANGNPAGLCVVQSHKTSATARVGCSHVQAFQAYVDDLESNHGAAVYFMGGVRRGKCWSGGLHPCGKALDVCQLSRGRVAPKCNLPRRADLAAIAERHGLVEGGRWSHSDYGHAQVGGYAGMAVEEIGSTAMAARSKRNRNKTAAAATPLESTWRNAH